MKLNCLYYTNQITEIMTDVIGPDIGLKRQPLEMGSLREKNESSPSNNIFEVLIGS